MFGYRICAYCLLIMCALALPVKTFALDIVASGMIRLGAGAGHAETLAYHAARRAVLVTDSESKLLHWVALGEGRNLTTRRFAEFATPPTSVAIHDDSIVVALEGRRAHDTGALVVLDMSGEELARYPTGALPDSVAISGDGRFLVSANEGEPSEDLRHDPQGSFTIVDIGKDVQHGRVRQVGLQGWRVPKGARLAGAANMFAVSAEPEFVTILPDNRTAYVTLQESNALARLDLPSAQLTQLTGFGYKPMRQGAYDFSDKDGGIRRWRWPLPIYGMYQPDAIASFVHKGQTWLVTANEGDAVDKKGFSEETRVGDLRLDPNIFPQPARLQDDSRLGRLKVTSQLGDANKDKRYEALYAFGGRSFSIWDMAGKLVYDSGDALSDIIARNTPHMFNANGSADTQDERSDDKGAEPEGVAVGRLSGVPYIFIVTERSNGIFAYNAADPTQPQFAAYHLAAPPHNGPEGVIFIPAHDSPNGMPLLVVAFEKSSTLGIFTLRP